MEAANRSLHRSLGSLRSLRMTRRKVHLIARSKAAERREMISLGRKPQEHEDLIQTEPPEGATDTQPEAHKKRSPEGLQFEIIDGCATEAAGTR